MADKDATPLLSPYDQVEMGCRDGSPSNLWELNGEHEVRPQTRFFSKPCCGCKRWQCLSILLAFYLLMAWMLRQVAQENQYPGDLGPRAEDVCTEFTFTGGDGSPMKGCRKHFKGIGAPPTPPKVPFLFFSGNGYGDVGAIGTEAALIAPQYRSVTALHPSLEAFSFSYRGYSPNIGIGHASETNIAADAEALLDDVLQQDSAHRSGGKVLVGGHSLGCAVALELARRRPEAIAGIVVFSPFTSMWDMDLIFWKPWSYAFFPWLWISAPDRWDNTAAAAALPTEVPVAMLCSGNDELIPATMQRQLFDTFRTKLKWFLPTAGATHGAVDLEADTQASGVADWLKASCDRLPEGC